MRKTILFIAMSLDGYIADKDGKVDWLAGESQNHNDMQSYEQFIKGIDTVVMGWNTYHQLTTELSPDVWMYETLMSYVITHHQKEDTHNIQFIHQDFYDFMQTLKHQDGKDIWICGGASIVQQCLENHLIDRLHISMIPTLLGDGIRLFQGHESEIKLKLIGTLSYNGITDLIYELR